MASSSDFFTKAAPLWTGQIGTGGVTDALVTTIPLSSVTGLVNGEVYYATIDRVDSGGTSTPSKREVVKGLLSGSNLTDCTRGVEGTAQQHNQGAVVEIMFTAAQWDDLVDGLQAEHNNDGTHSDITVDSINTHTVPAGTSTLVTLTATQTLTNKTLTSPTMTSPEVSSGDLDLESSTANITVNDTDPWRTVTIMPGLLKPTTTAGCASQAKVEAGTNDIDYDTLDFDASSDENAYANFQMPDSWDAGVVQFRAIWTNAGGGSSETIELEIAGRSFANDDAIDQANGTAVAITDTWIAQGDIHITAWSSDCTLAGTPAAGELVHIEVTRDVSDDNLTGDLRLIALQMRYKQAQYSD